MMRWLNHVLILCIFFLGSVMGFPLKGNAAPPAKDLAVQEPSSADLPEGQPPMQEHKLALDPFYRLQSNGSRVWMERILVIFTLTAPQNNLQHDVNKPTFRKMVYELLQSGEPEATIQAQAVDRLKRQVGTEIDPAVQISRSVLIVR